MRALAVVLAAAIAGCGPQQPKQQSPAMPPAPKIVHFYSGAAAIERGDTVSLCYGVENAASVRIEPPVEGVSPSPNRCVPAQPASDTEYRLIVTGRDGAVATQALRVRVLARRASKPGAPPPAEQGGPGLITEFAATASRIGAGEPVTLCFDARGAESVRLDPAPQAMPEGSKGCVVVRPSRTTTYRLIASCAGRSETRQVTISVQ